MSESKSNEDKISFKNTKVVKEGEKIILPTGMACRQAITVLEQQAAEEEMKVAIDEPVEGFLFEGMYAFQRAMARKFGWVNFVPTPGFFGDSPPTWITIDIGVNQKAKVAWGRIQIPGIEGYLHTGVTLKDGRSQFQIGGQVKRKNLDVVNELAALTRKIVREESIYRGKAVRLTLQDLSTEDLDITLAPTFIDTSGTDPTQLIFSDYVQEAVQTALFTPVEKTQLLRDLGISRKRGTLLAGRYGVGKSLAATVLAKKCEDNGWTYIYLTRQTDVAKALVIAKQYQPCVLFVEDIDKAVSGARDEKLDNILNTLDGVDSKNQEIMVVFTTNDMASIDKAMLRAKRLDYVIEITPPDGPAVERLIRRYSGASLQEGADLAEVGLMLAGQIPATIEEVCSRAQLNAAGRVDKASDLKITAKDLEYSTASMLAQLELTAVPVKKSYTDDVERAAEVLVEGIKTFMLPAAAKDNGIKQLKAHLPAAS